MKKQKLGLNKLNVTKSRIATLNAKKQIGGTAATNQFCYLSSPLDIIVCPFTATCNTGDACGHTKNGCETQACGSGNCNTLQDITCIELC
ncbi:MAG: hypothetical protein AAF611_08160 [Bacteroidota bacterium]